MAGRGSTEVRFRRRHQGEFGSPEGDERRGALGRGREMPLNPESLLF